VGGESFPLTIETEKRGGGTVGMRPEKNLAAAQCGEKTILSEMNEGFFFFLLYLNDVIIFLSLNI
jgi:hypothetical protein